MNIEEYVGTDKVFFAPSGSMAIFSVLYPFRKKTLGIPDQGSFKNILKIAELLDLQHKFITTEKGIILPEKIKNVEIFIFSSFSGYLVENNVEKIVSHCKKMEYSLLKTSHQDFHIPDLEKEIS